MSLDNFIVIECDIMCYTTKPRCKNKAEYYLDDEMVYMQLCEKCMKEEKYFTDPPYKWKKGIDKKQEKTVRKFYF